MQQPFKCTWIDCDIRFDLNNPAYPQLGRDEKAFAYLCEKHHKELEEAITKGLENPKIILSAWVKARGGAKAMAKSILGRGET